MAKRQILELHPLSQVPLDMALPMVSMFTKKKKDGSADVDEIKNLPKADEL